jgi:hypothetical protein
MTGKKRGRGLRGWGEILNDGGRGEKRGTMEED